MSSIKAHIPYQFPSIYREEPDQFFIEFVKAYYDFVDTHSAHDEFSGNFLDLNDIDIVTDASLLDDTFKKFLDKFRLKYLKGYPNLEGEKLNFVVKNIFDLYKRKGTEESIILFFQIFFNETPDIFYPEVNVLRISDSTYTEDSYLEMESVLSWKNYPFRVGDRIVGLTSGASASISQVLFRVLGGELVPVLFLDDIQGNFISNDSLKISNLSSDDNRASTYHNRIRGSLSSISIIDGIPENNIGDSVEVISSQRGFGGKATVTEISKQSDGIVRFEIESGGYGYGANTEVFISNQILLVAGDELEGFAPFEEIALSEGLGWDISDENGETLVDNEGNRIVAGEGSTSWGVAPSGHVIDYIHPILFIHTTDALKFTQGESDFFVGRRFGDAFPVANVYEFNDSADFQVEETSETETVSIYEDVIGDYANMTLDSADYGMSGVGPVNANTAIEDAFTPRVVTIGEIERIGLLSSGAGYTYEVRAYLRNPELNTDSNKNIIITFDDYIPNLYSGEIVTQTITNFFGDVVEAKAKYIRKIGNTHEFEPYSYTRISDKVDLTIRGVPYSIRQISYVDNSKNIGENAIVKATTENVSGKIKSVSINDTGFLYQDGEEVRLVKDGIFLAEAQIECRGAGKSEGRWKDKKSLLNERTKVIHDNYYYQAYSYDIMSSVNEERYGEIVDDLLSVGGTKRFVSSFIKSEVDSANGIEYSITVE